MCRCYWLSTSWQTKKRHYIAPKKSYSLSVWEFLDSVKKRERGVKTPVCRMCRSTASYFHIMVTNTLCLPTVIFWVWFLEKKKENNTKTKLKMILTDSIMYFNRSCDLFNLLNLTYYTIIYSPHTLIFSFQICTCQTSYIIVFIVFDVFATLYIAYLYICILFFCCLCPVLLLSFCCTVELLSL